jgi:hypothetical protein
MLVSRPLVHSTHTLPHRRYAFVHGRHRMTRCTTHCHSACIMEDGRALREDNTDTAACVCADSQLRTWVRGSRCRAPRWCKRDRAERANASRPGRP